jgi:hypothetical protein
MIRGAGGLAGLRHLIQLLTRPERSGRSRRFETIQEAVQRWVAATVRVQVGV